MASRKRILSTLNKVLPKTVESGPRQDGGKGYSSEDSVGVACSTACAFLPRSLCVLMCTGTLADPSDRASQKKAGLSKKVCNLKERREHLLLAKLET